MSHTYEVEIKSLLGSVESKDKLKSSLMAAYPDTKLVGQGKQLNHYFNIPTDIAPLIKNILPLISEEKKTSLEQTLRDGKKMSLRSREADGKVILVLKASIGDDTSANGVKRIEFEAVVDKTLAELDKLLLDAGATYQAKWSREREEYASGDMRVCIDKNAGYGYLAEFEKITTDELALDSIKAELLNTMAKLGVSELSQERLERMFAHYNANWKDYYGTENVFIIE
jgi:predicted adenylyl cyclase CyaB